MRGGLLDVSESLVNARDLSLDSITYEGRDVLLIAVETNGEPVFEWIFCQGYLADMANKAKFLQEDASDLCGANGKGEHGTKSHQQRGCNNRRN